MTNNVLSSVSFWFAACSVLIVLALLPHLLCATSLATRVGAYGLSIIV